MTAIRQMPTPEGRDLGKELARFADQGESAVRLVAPAHPTKCGTCAFKLGTAPNAMADTLMSAVKCLIEHEPFYCHERKDEAGDAIVCMGWLFAMGPLPWGEPGKAPWEHAEPAERDEP